MAFSNQEERGRPVKIKDEGVSLVDNVSEIDFVGGGVTGTNVGDAVTETITGASGNESENETPTGTINGSNKVFTVANAPSPAASLRVYLNGAFQTAAGEDYTLVGGTITFVNAPLSGSVLRAFYKY